MGNLSYCRMHNTENVLSDVEDHIDDMDLSEDENIARINIIIIARRIVEKYQDKELGIYFEDNSEDDEDEEDDE